MKQKFVKIPLGTIEDAIAEDDYVGFCRVCGAEHYEVEPDAEKYECNECGAHQVYGAEQLLIMGEVS